MNRFVIVDGLPFLLADGKTYAVRWNDEGFTVGTEVLLPSVPTVTHSEIAIMAQCAGRLDSITETIQKPKNGRKRKAAENDDSDG